jgi:hypothetical protein
MTLSPVKILAAPPMVLGRKVGAMQMVEPLTTVVLQTRRLPKTGRYVCSPLLGHFALSFLGSRRMHPQRSTAFLL